MFRLSSKRCLFCLLLVQQLVTHSYAANDTSITIAGASAAAGTTTTSAPTFAVVDNIVILDQNQNQSSPTTTTTTHVRPPCDIRCMNGGSCYYISNDSLQLEYESQAGRPIQRCHCPDGFGGVACEIPNVETCDLTTLTCRVSQRPCEAMPGFSNSADGHPMLTCACYVADAIARAANDATNFAGRACRKGYTEYCSSRYDPNAERLFFCTNGGKCLADFLAARVSPGNTTANRDYEDAGCRCNSNFFYGPHCEFLKLDADSLSHLGTTDKKENADDADAGTTTSDDRDGYGNQDSGSGGSSYGASSAESGNDAVSSSVRSSGTDTVKSAEYRNKAAAFFAFVSFLGVLFILTLYLAIRRNHLRRRRRRARRALEGGGDAIKSLPHTMSGDIMDGSCGGGRVWDHAPTTTAQQQYHDDDFYNSDNSEAQDDYIMDNQEAGIMGAAPIVVNGVGGYPGWNNDDINDISDDHDVRGLVQDIQDDDDEGDEWDESDDEDDDKDNDAEDDNEHELISQYNSTVEAAFEPPQDLINTSISGSEDQTSVFSSQESSPSAATAADLVSQQQSCHAADNATVHTADTTVPASNTYYYSASSLSSSRGEELLSVLSEESVAFASPPASRGDEQSEAKEQEPDNDASSFHLL
jgi:hypothetical protein